MRDRHELARKLGWGQGQPASAQRIARARRARVMELVEAGWARKRIMEEMGISAGNLKSDVCVMRRREEETMKDEG